MLDMTFLLHLAVWLASDRSSHKCSSGADVAVGMLLIRVGLGVLDSRLGPTFPSIAQTCLSLLRSAVLLDSSIEGHLLSDVASTKPGTARIKSFYLLVCKAAVDLGACMWVWCPV